MFEGNEATQYGTDHEPIALAAYSAQTAIAVTQTGFIPHPSIDWLGGSPDGLTNDRVVEIKCPFGQKVYDDCPSHYMAQVQGLMECVNLPSCDLAVWTPEKLRVFTIERSPEYWNWMFPKLAEFWCYVKADVEPPRAKKGQFDFSGLIAGVKDYELV